MDINKLLEEREAVHGPHKDEYNLVWELWEVMIENTQFRSLPGWMKVELMMVDFKKGRGIYKPDQREHFIDMQGYSGLILKEIQAE